MKGAEPLQLTKQPVVSAASQRWRTRTSNGSGRSVGRSVAVGGRRWWSVVGGRCSQECSRPVVVAPG
jgi:hypothetical protein